MLRLGFWSAALCALTFILFPICYVAVLATGGVFTWTNLADYAAHAQRYGQVFQNLAQWLMLAFGLSYLVLLAGVYEAAPADRKPLARLSLVFAIPFAGLTGTHYFVQVSVVRLALASGQLAGLEQLVQANPYSAMAAANMLGWTLFFGLSTLFAAAVFSGGRLKRVISLALLVNAIGCLAGGVGYVFAIVPLVFVTMNLVMGGAVTVAAIGLWVLFGRLLRQSAQ